MAHVARHGTEVAALACGKHGSLLAGAAVIAAIVAPAPGRLDRPEAPLPVEQAQDFGTLSDLRSTNWPSGGLAGAIDVSGGGNAWLAVPAGAGAGLGATGQSIGGAPLELVAPSDGSGSPLFPPATASGPGLDGGQPTDTGIGPHQPLLLTGVAPAGISISMPGSDGPLGGAGAHLPRLAAEVPETSSALLFLTGLIGLRRFRFRK